MTSICTGSHQIDAALGLYTELQVGSYVFMDEQYLACEFEPGATPFETSLFIDTRVVSTNTPGVVTVDGGRDPTVNLYDTYHVVKKGVLKELWPVSARGRSR